ncbi:hypothetical protein K461DRAFT_280048 [Myriangium duriaei CBS 260.36]|uniref:Eukaryotic mitochondrial regulator protein-domain-containing protein n=1 Tax=Myriangium duriaei CBS 260.36 TaxID=1168546 RepID=A0A9P4MFM8_9PEZI|nr:hypothetical protein K461DRAFT_280048 [Myriangium duriaei CBS 260.36]
MGATQLVREPCRQILHRPQIISLSSSHTVIDACRPAQRTFSETHAARAEDDERDGGRVRQAKAPTRLRRQMYQWLNSSGRNFSNPLPGSTNYLTAYTPSGRLRNRPENSSPEIAALEEEEERRPYPLNKHFISQAVLSDELKDVIYEKVVIKGQSVSSVSADLNVDMRRVAAVVRLKEVEKKWAKDGTPFADAYATAVTKMLPTTPYNAEGAEVHESINDLPVHPATRQQIFYPISESREFNRRDAAKVFSPSLLPPDERIPHPELIEVERGIDLDVEDEEGQEEMKDRMAEQLRQAAATAKAKVEAKRQAAEAARTKVVKGSRWNFKFETIDANVAAGKDGRSPVGVGWRYGMPYEDRKRGNQKGIPTKMEV